LKGIRIVIGEVGGMASVARALNRHLVRLGALTTTLHDPDEHAQAQAANEASADLFLALRLLPTNRGVSCAYYAGYRDESVAGRHLAELIASSAPSLLDVANLGARGMSVAILRETRMPAVLVEVGPVEVIVEGAATLADAVASALVQWVQTSSE
jgi:N-acetylmuramoyl-L-alanine amidase